METGLAFRWTLLARGDPLPVDGPQVVSQILAGRPTS